MKKFPLFLVLLLAPLIFLSCAEVKTITEDGEDAELTCGVVEDGDTLNTTVNTVDGKEAVVVTVYSGNTLAIEEKNDDGSYGAPILVKLQGVKDTPVSKRSAAVSRIQSLTSGTVYFFRAHGDCTATGTGGGAATVGAIITNDLLSVGEEVIKAGLADVEAADACGGDLIGSCLQSVFGNSLETMGELDAFLWKPVSDSDGRLAVHTGPYDTEVYVNDERGTNAGSGNGYGSLARFSKSGCGYPAPRIQVLDQSSGLPYTVGGSTTFTVADPCGRHCLTDGKIQSCSK